MLNGVDRYEWERLVRRCQLTAPTKLVALTMATYANADGTSIYPGVARLTAVTGLSDRSVRAALKALRDVGLVERTVEGSRAGRRALADEHRLTVPDDLLERVMLLPPDEKAPAPGAGDRSGAAAPGAGAAPRSAARAAGDGDGSPAHPAGDEPAEGHGSPARHAGSPARHAGSPARRSGTPAPGAAITGTSCTPPTHAPTTHQPITNVELPNRRKSRPREDRDDKVIRVERWGR
ncbi:helix-turn-helix domain-containing protein [Blastococcus sp. SYSU D00813]